MGFFDIFKKPVKSSKTVVAPPSCFDKADYYFEDAMKNFCCIKHISEEDLTEEHYSEIRRIAATHIGFFITWLIKHDFVGDIHMDNSEAVDAVKSDCMTGVDFLLDYCDGKLYP